MVTRNKIIIWNHPVWYSGKVTSLGLAATNQTITMCQQIQVLLCNHTTSSMLYLKYMTRNRWKQDNFMKFIFSCQLRAFWQRIYVYKSTHELVYVSKEQDLSFSEEFSFDNDCLFWQDLFGLVWIFGNCSCNIHILVFLIKVNEIHLNFEVSWLCSNTLYQKGESCSITPGHKIKGKLTTLWQMLIIYHFFVSMMESKPKY